MSPQHCKSFGHLALPQLSPAECREMVTEKNSNALTPAALPQALPAVAVPGHQGWRMLCSRGHSLPWVLGTPSRKDIPAQPTLPVPAQITRTAPTLCLLLACFFPRPGRAFPASKEAPRGPKRLNFYHVQVGPINPQQAWSSPGPPSKSSRTDPEGQELIQRHACLQALWSGILEKLLTPDQLPLCRVLSTEGAEHGTCWVPQESPAHTACTAQASTAYISSWKTAFFLTFTTAPVYTRKSLAPEPPEGE